MVALTEPVAGSILETVASRLFATHTASRPTAIAPGPWPTGIVVMTLPDSRSSCSTTPASYDATQIVS